MKHLTQPPSKGIMSIMYEAMIAAQTEMLPMNAIWVSAIRKKLFVGDTVTIQGGKFVPDTNAPTHHVTALNGTASGNRLAITLVNKNEETLIIEL